MWLIALYEIRCAEIVQQKWNVSLFLPLPIATVPSHEAQSLEASAFASWRLESDGKESKLRLQWRARDACLFFSCTYPGVGGTAFRTVGVERCIPKVRTLRIVGKIYICCIMQCTCPRLLRRPQSRQCAYAGLRHTIT